jgi:hypothetical protein
MKDFSSFIMFILAERYCSHSYCHPAGRVIGLISGVLQAITWVTEVMGWRVISTQSLSRQFYTYLLLHHKHYTI